ncbi:MULTISPECIES: MFS transporter [Clostridium]|uniref:MFS transporter n=1 Tax=Clostridium TaxID=1485 RepID=UPI000825E0D2|nr:MULTISPECIES: MFS transporter [Clostridium]PJI06825.1 MFS transporter [Clostridium sp. CT7]
MEKSVFSRYEINFVVSLAVAMALRQLAMVMILPFMSVYGKTLLYSTPALVGIAIGIYGLIQGIMQMPFGSLSDRIGRKNVITIGSLFLALGLALAAMATNIYLLILARALQGIGAVAAVCFSWIGDNIEEKKRNQAMGIVGIFSGAAGVIGFVGGPFLYNLISVLKLFLCCSILVFLSWLYIVIFLKKDDNNKTNKKAKKVDYKGLIKNKLFVKLSISGFIISYAMVSIFYIVPIVLEKSVGTASMWKVFLPATLIGIVIMIVSSKIADRGKSGVMAFLSFACVLFGGASLFFNNFYVILLGTTFFMAGYMNLSAILPGSVTKLSTKDTRGTITGIYNTVQFIGSFAGGALTGLLWGINNHLPPVFIVLVSVLGCILVRRLENSDNYKVDNKVKVHE